jgi:hypothetical protein
VAVLDSGNFISAWRAITQSTQFYDIFGNIFGPSGIPSGPAFGVNEYGYGGQVRPAVSRLSNGGFVVAWQSSKEGQSGDGVFAKFYFEDGTVDVPEFQVSYPPALDARDPDLTQLLDGTVVFVWTRKVSSNTPGRVFFRRFESSGSPLDQAVGLSEAVASDQSQVRVAALQNGGFVAVWRASKNNDKNEPDDEVDVFAARFDEYGNRLYH